MYRSATRSLQRGMRLRASPRSGVALLFSRAMSTSDFFWLGVVGVVGVGVAVGGPCFGHENRNKIGARAGHLMGDYVEMGRPDSSYCQRGLSRSPIFT